jgi:hypothetical protein
MICMNSLINVKKKIALLFGKYQTKNKKQKKLEWSMLKAIKDKNNICCRIFVYAKSYFVANKANI